MIINFSVKNFGPIKDWVTLSFEADGHGDLDEFYLIEPKEGLHLLKLGLIFGPNASGKTTILKALDFFVELVLNPAEKKTDKLDFTPFLFHPEYAAGNTFFSLEFIHEGVRHLYTLELNASAIVREELIFHEPNKATLFERETDLEKQFTHIKLGSKIKMGKSQREALEANTLWNNTVLGGYLKTNVESAEMQRAADWFKEVWWGMVDPKLDLFAYVSQSMEDGTIDKENLLALLSKADFNITGIEIKKEERQVDAEMVGLLKKYLPESRMEEIEKTGKMERKTVLFQHTVYDEEAGRRHFPLEIRHESQGTQRYYELGGLLDLLLRKSMVLSIDELETSLHPDLLEHFLLTFLVNAKNAQLIATTHQRELLLKRGILRHDAIWFTDKKKDGGTDLYSAADFDSSVLRKDSSLYNAYKIGKLGAKPNLGDTYLHLENQADGTTK